MHKRIALPPAAYSVDNFAHVIGLSSSLVWELVSDGRVKSVKIAGRRLIPATEVTRLLAEAA